MKRTIKFIIPFIFGAITGLHVFAQDFTNESAVMTAGVTVQGALSITRDADVNFGNISATTDDIVRLVPDGSSSAYVGSNATTGKFTISGSPSTSILISYPAGITLIANESDQIAYSLHVFGNTTDSQASSIQLSDEGIGVDNISNTLDVTSGNYFLYVGGALGGTIGGPAPLTDQAAGEYTGTVTFEVKYN
jgi:hypothetical protein